MTKSRVSSYRLFSLIAVAATSILVACAPDDAPLMESAAFTCEPSPAKAIPAGLAAPIARPALPMT